MTREEYADRLRQELAGVHVSPTLRHCTLSALKEKEQPIMKKKISTALVFVLVMLLLGTVALAAAGHWGLLDFVGRYGGSHVPSNAPDYIQKDVAAWETDALSVTVREMYYDGRYLQAVVDVKARDEKTLLVSDANTVQYTMTGVSDTSAERGDIGRVLAVSPVITSDEGISPSCRQQEDGALTFYIEAGYHDYQPGREVELSLLITPHRDPVTGAADSATEHLSFPLTLTVPAGVAPVVYVCNTPQEYPASGIRVEHLSIEALPLSLYATIQYSAMDEDQYALRDDALWFEFCDPVSMEAIPCGLTFSGSVRTLEGRSFIQRCTLGVNDLHDEYALRLFNEWTRAYDETRFFRMQKVNGD